MSEKKQLLCEGAELMNIALSDQQIQQLLNYVALIHKWNKVYNLSAIHDPIESINTHLLDTFSIIHFVLHSVMLLASLNMWIPVVGLDHRIKQLSFPLRIGYLFIQSLLPTIPASFLAFSTVPIYSAYLEVEQIYNISVINDQTLAGLVLKLGGGVILWVTILIIWMNWYKAEKKASDFEKSTRTDN